MKRPAKPARCIDRINQQLVPTGHRMFRNVRGGSYYYVMGPKVQCSIYCYFLEPTQKDFEYAAAEVNEAFRNAGLAEPIHV